MRGRHDDVAYSSLSLYLCVMHTNEDGLPIEKANRLDRMAEAQAKMEKGLYAFPDGKPRYHVDGSYRAPMVDVLEAGGYSRKSNSARKLFKHPYFLKRLAIHRQRLDGGFQKALAELTDGGRDLTTLTSKLFETLLLDLADPEVRDKIPFRDRSRLYHDLTKLHAATKGSSETPRRPTATTTNILAIMGDGRMDEETFNEYVHRLREEHERAAMEAADVEAVVEG